MGFISKAFQVVTGRREGIVKTTCRNKQSADAHLALAYQDGAKGEFLERQKTKAWSGQYHMDKNDVTPETCRDYDAWDENMETLTKGIMEAYGPTE